NGLSRYRWLTLSPRRARPPATTRATQLTHIGIDQSRMMTDQSITIRARWASATTAKITPATRENVFASMSHHPKFRTQDSTPRGGGCERGANDLVTKMVTNGSPRTGIERHELPRPATFPDTNQHLRGLNKMGRDESDQTYIPFRTVIDLHGMKVNRVLLLRGALLSIFVVAGAADVARAQVFAPA